MQVIKNIWIKLIFYLFFFFFFFFFFFLLYPQLAIADDCNSYKRDSSQVYHTKVCHGAGLFLKCLFRYSVDDLNMSAQK